MTNRIPKIIVREQEKALKTYEVISSVPSSSGRFRQVVLRSGFPSKRGARGWSKTVEARIMAMIAKEAVRLITEAGPDQSGLESHDQSLMELLNLLGGRTSPANDVDVVTWIARTKAFLNQQVEFAILTAARVFELIEPCDPDKLDKDREYYTALWVGGSFTDDQFLALQQNPLVHLHTKVFKPATPHTHAVIFSILRDQKRS